MTNTSNYLKKIFGLYLKTLKQYAVFKGRATRSEFWTFMITNLVLHTLVAFLTQIASEYRPWFDNSLDLLDLFVFFYNVNLILSLLLLLPTFAVTARRLHDVGVGTWLVNVVFLPIIAALVMFITILISPKDASVFASQSFGAGLLLAIIILFLTPIGLLGILLLCLQDSQIGTNKYGPNPKDLENTNSL